MDSRGQPRTVGFASLTVALAVLVTGCGDNSAPPTPTTAPQQSAAPTPEPVAAEAVDPAMLTAQVTVSATFETGEGWGPQYAAARNKPGVVVGPGSDNANVFAQQFKTQPGEPFKIVAKASSVGAPTASGRLQINWSGADDKFISASITPIDVVSEEKSFEAVVVAPPGATTGFLYVAPHGEKDVVRYTEMRLLGKANRETPKN